MLETKPVLRSSDVQGVLEMLGCGKPKAVLNTLPPELFSENACLEINCCHIEGKLLGAGFSWIPLL